MSDTSESDLQKRQQLQAEIDRLDSLINQAMRLFTNALEGTKKDVNDKRYS